MDDNKEVIDLCEADKDDPVSESDAVVFVRTIAPRECTSGTDRGRLRDNSHTPICRNSGEQHESVPMKAAVEQKSARTCGSKSNIDINTSSTGSLVQAKSNYTQCQAGEYTETETRKPTVQERQREEKERLVANQFDLANSFASTESSTESATQAPEMISFEIAGTPKTKSRPKIAKAGHFYNPSSSDEKKFRLAASDQLRRSYGYIPKFYKSTPLRVELEFRFCESEFHLQSVPDIDNLTKLVLDSLNKMLYYDDRQVVDLAATKGITTGVASKTVVKISKTDVAIWKVSEI